VAIAHELALFSQLGRGAVGLDEPAELEQVDEIGRIPLVVLYPTRTPVVAERAYRRSPLLELARGPAVQSKAPYRLIHG
jgi:hypothetical protein